MYFLYSISMQNDKYSITCLYETENMKHQHYYTIEKPNT